MSENENPNPTPTEGDPGKGEETPQSFTQADVDRIVAERLKREREATKAKYADYDDLKSQAGEKATADERLAALERELEASKREALRRRVQAAHGISDEDADLFLTGTDEDALTAQAKRLAERTPPERKNHAPREGTNPRPGEDEMAAFARGLFDRAKAQ